MDEPRVGSGRGGLLICLTSVVILVFMMAVFMLADPQSPPIGTSRSACLSQSDVAQQEADTVLIRSKMDASADPCENFYQYACGTYVKETKIPDDKNSISAFAGLADRNLETLRELAEQKWPLLDEYYSSCLNESALEARGPTKGPLAESLRELAAVNSKAKLWLLLGKLDAVYAIHPFLETAVEPALADATLNRLNIYQGGTTLPTLTLYNNKTKVGLYKEHIKRLMKLSGVGTAEGEQIAEAVAEVETSIANFSLTPVQFRDPTIWQNPRTLTELVTAHPHIGWSEYATGAGWGVFPAGTQVNLFASVDYFKGLDAYLEGASMDKLKLYFKWRLLHRAVPYLASAFREESFAFFGKELSGTLKQAPRWKTCVRSLDGMGDLLGRYFAMQNFTQRSKDAIDSMVMAIKAEFTANLFKYKWMDDTTRKVAVEKVKAMKSHVGVPDEWTSWHGVNFDKEEYLGNSLLLQKRSWDKNMKKVGGKVDREEWDMTVPTVNAYYHPSLNTINFPAGILQPPFFAARFPAAHNFGSMGSVIGHELSHGFDDQGRLFGPMGNKRDWWTNPSATNYKKRAKCISDQYSKISPDGGKHFINGDLTNGENIADNIGVMTSFGAWQAVTPKKEQNQHIDRAQPGISQKQLFYLSFAQVWCRNVRESYAVMALERDPHSPSIGRVNGVMRNQAGFAEAFSCPKGSPMNPGDEGRCSWLN